MDDFINIAAFAVTLISNAFILIFIPLLIVGVVLDFRKHFKKEQELSRAVDKMIERQAAAKEGARIYEETYQREDRALKKCLSDELDAISRGEKIRLSSAAVEAAKTIMERQGVNNPGVAQNHPQIYRTWTTLIDDLSVEHVRDARAIQRRFDELLFPDALEDYENDEEIKRLAKEYVKSLSHGEKKPLDPKVVDGLRKIRDRSERRRRADD